MNPETEKIIKKQIEKLPQGVRDFIADSAVGEQISSIGGKNGLKEEDEEIFLMETYLVLLGLVRPDDYKKELGVRLKIDDLKLDNIVDAINKEIFGSIKEKLDETYNKLDEAEEQKIIEELKSKKTTLPQDVNFILSGGDYSVFLENHQRPPTDDASGDKLIGTSNILETKRKLIE